MTKIPGQLFDLPNLFSKSFILLAATGLARFLGGLMPSFAAIGANRASPVRSLSVPFTLVMAVFVLKERVSVVNGIGIVVLAPVIMFRRESKTTTVDPSWLAEGYFFALISGLASGIAPLLMSEGIGGTGLGIALSIVGSVLVVL